MLKQCDLKTAEWNKFYGAFLNEIKSTFVEEIKKYERKSFEAEVLKPCGTKLQVGYRPNLVGFNPPERAYPSGERAEGSPCQVSASPF